MGNQNGADSEKPKYDKKYEKNFLLNLSENKTGIIFGILNAGYRIILFIILCACVYTSKSNNRLLSEVDKDDDYKQKYNNFCSLSGCEKCTPLNICTSCFTGYEPIYRNNEIIKCHNPYPN